MALQISASSCLCSSPTSTKSRLQIFSLLSYRKTSKSQLFGGIPHLGSSHFSSYIGLKHLGISICPKTIKLERKRSCRGMVVHASLFGVGAPEALVIGVVALLVFGPKGLAEVARNLGKTLRAFQPTIRELQDVSREFKSTLEREIGLDEVSTPNTYSTYRPPNTSSAPPSASETGDPVNVADPNGASSLEKAYTTEEYLKITEEQLKAASAQQSEPSLTPRENTAETQTQSEIIAGQPSSATSPAPASERETT